MGRTHAAGQSIWIKHATPGGVVYFTRTDDPGYGYLDPTGRTEQPLQRYSLSYIDFVWRDPSDRTPVDRLSDVASRETREITATAAQGTICVPYGRCRRGPDVITWGTNNASSVFIPYSVGQGPIAGNWSVWMDTPQGEKELTFPSLITSDGIQATQYTELGLNALFRFATGTATPTVDPYYQRATNGRGPGGGYGVEIFPFLACVFARFEINSYVQEPRPIFTFDGRTLRDPRLGVDGSGIPNQPEVFSKTPALAWADYRTSTRYGTGTPDDKINWDSVAEVATYNETLIAGLPRHTINWAFMRTGAQHRAVLDAIRTLGRFDVIRRDGKLVLVARKARSRVSATITPSNSTAVEVEKISPATMSNVVRVAWTNPANNYQTEYAYWPETGIPADGRPPIVKDVAAEGCTQEGEAKRLAAEVYAEERNPLRVTVLTKKAELLQLEPGDRVPYYSPTALLGSSLSDMQDLNVVKTGKKADGTAVIVCNRYSDGDYSTATGTNVTGTINTAASPLAAPTAPKSPAGAASLTVGDGITHVVGSRYAINWKHDGWTFPLRFKVTVQPSGGTETVIAPEASSGPVYFDFGGSMLTHTFRVYAFVAATLAMSTALSGTCVPGVPEWPGGDTVIDFSTAGTVKLRIDVAPARARNLYGASVWSFVNGTGSWSATDASKVNDGNFTNACGTTSGDINYLVADFGVARSIRQIRIRHSAVVHPLGVANNWQTSTDNINWTTPTGWNNYKQGLSKYGDSHTETLLVDGNSTSPTARYLRIPILNSVTLYEVQVYEDTAAVSPSTNAINVYDISDGSASPRLVRTLTPNADNMVDVSTLVRRDRSSIANSYRLALRLRGVNFGGGGESDPFDVSLVDFQWNGTTQVSSALASMHGVESLYNKTYLELKTTSQDPAAKLTGTRFYDGVDGGDGVAILHYYGGANNRQIMFADPAQLSSTTIPGVRFALGTSDARIDARAPALAGSVKPLILNEGLRVDETGNVSVLGPPSSPLPFFVKSGGNTGLYATQYSTTATKLQSSNQNATATADLVVNPDGGNVGIGGAPGEKLTVTATGTNALARIKTTTTGATNAANLAIERGDQANGYAQTSYFNGATSTWSTGLRAGDAKYHIRYDPTGAEVTVDTVGNLNIPNDQGFGFGAGSSFILGSSASSYLKFYTGNTERARIDSVGNFRLTSTAGLEWGGSSDFIYGDATLHKLGFRTNGTEQLSIDANGVVTFNNTLVLQNGPKVITGSGSPEGAVSAPVGSSYHDTSTGDEYVKKSGTGTTGWAALASNYAEGTWSPVRNGFTENIGGGSITTSGTYTRIGRMVHVRATITCSGGATIASVASNSYLSGLPFTPAVTSVGRWLNLTTEGTTGTLSVRTPGMITIESWTAASNTWVFEAWYTI